MNYIYFQLIFENNTKIIQKIYEYIHDIKDIREVYYYYIRTIYEFNKIINEFVQILYVVNESNIDQLSNILNKYPKSELHFKKILFMFIYMKYMIQLAIKHISSDSKRIYNFFNNKNNNYFSRSYNTNTKESAYQYFKNEYIQIIRILSIYLSNYKFDNIQKNIDFFNNIVNNFEYNEEANLEQLKETVKKLIDKEQISQNGGFDKYKLFL